MTFFPSAIKQHTPTVMNVKAAFLEERNLEVKWGIFYDAVSFIRTKGQST